VIGDQCSLFTKGIGLTINEILRNKIQSNISFRKQSVLIQTAAGLAMIMLFGTARRRSTAKTNKKSFKEHVISQIREHKQLLISPFILLVLALPRLIMSLVSGCVDPSENPWLYLCGYLISFTPPMLVFTVFVLPSELYRKTFTDSITRWLRQIHQ